MNWLMPQVRQGAILDPVHEDWIGNAAANFHVTGDDLVARPVPAQRPSLGQIFAAGSNAVPMTPANPLIPPNSNVGPSPPPIGGTESGSFFQRKVREQPKETS